MFVQQCNKFISKCHAVVVSAAVTIAIIVAVAEFLQCCSHRRRNSIHQHLIAWLISSLIYPKCQARQQGARHEWEPGRHCCGSQCVQQSRRKRTIVGVCLNNSMTVESRTSTHQCWIIFVRLSASLARCTAIDHIGSATLTVQLRQLIGHHDLRRQRCQQQRAAHEGDPAARHKSTEGLRSMQLEASA